MAFGLPSAEQMRDYLISQGVDPVVAAERANVAARQNAAQAARTSALSIAAGAAPARAAGAAAVEAAPAVARGAMGIGERIAAAPRQAWEYLTTPAGVVRNPTTGARIPTRNVTTGRMERTPDYFLPGQRVAQGTAGGLALGAGTSGVGALMDQNTAGPTPEVQAAIDAARARQEIDDRDAQTAGPEIAQLAAQNRMAVDDRDAGARQSGIAELAARNRTAAVDAAKQRMAGIQATGNAAGMPPARPQESMLSNIFNNPVSTRELFNRAEANPDDSGAYMRAERQYAATHKDAPSVDLSKLNPDTGMKRGGAANAKPDSLHKALEIIHHLLTRNH